MVAAAPALFHIVPPPAPPVRGDPYLMSTKFSDFLTPSCLPLELIYTIKLSQPPLLRMLFHDPPPPSDVDIISG